ncbi:hypothetical protein CARUB_v10020210mg [Capsella rubella]|uniref:MADS-box domain-containing protein n=1 Tax=Capsella rubella TaxID=81985 RepID=R0GC85_9BRAS|nr:hypothetical protein CARUB_v10020210mg [Capsella rubella]
MSGPIIKSGMGRVKLKIKKLQSMNARQSTYAKRKHGIMKKAKELSILCDIDVVLLMFSPTGKASLCIGKHSIGEVIAKFAQVIPQERTKRKLDSLEALRKMFVKIDHVVDISGFLDRSTPAVEVCNTTSMMLINNYDAEVSPNSRLLSGAKRKIQVSANTVIRYTHTTKVPRSSIYCQLNVPFGFSILIYSCWNDLENIDNLDDLQQLEHSLRLSLAQISARKASMPQLQRRQLMSSECKNELQTEIDIDFGMEMEQQLENFSWVRTDGNMNVPLKEEDPNLKLHQMYRDVTCSASSSLGNYTGIFSKSSDYISAPKLEPSSIPGISADPNVEFSNLSFLNDQKLQQLAEWNLLGSPADYYVSQILEASYKPQLGGNNNWASSDTLPYVAVFDDPLYFRVNNGLVLQTVSEQIEFVAAAKVREVVPGKKKKLKEELIRKRALSCTEQSQYTNAEEAKIDKLQGHILYRIHMIPF